MIAMTESSLLQQWQERLGGRRRYTLPRPLASLGYLTKGPVIEGLLEIEKLLLVVLHDEPDEHGRCALRLSGFSGGRVPWGIQWGGVEQSKFFKDFLLEPMPTARGLRVDAAKEDLLRLGLQLERELSRHVRYGRGCKHPQVRLPRLWAGFRSANAAGITGAGPELAAYSQKTGQSAAELLFEYRRNYFGLALYPFAWVSHHWPQAVAVFADLHRYPLRQVIPLRTLPDDLVGCQGVAHYDFYASSFRLCTTPRGGATPAAALAPA